MEIRPLAERVDSTNFYGIDKGLWDRDSVTFHNRETTALGLDFISEQGARGAYTGSSPEESRKKDQIFGRKIASAPWYTVASCQNLKNLSGTTGDPRR